MSNKKSLIYAAIFREMQSVCTKLTDAVQFINLYFIAVLPDTMPADVPFTRNFYLKLSFTSINFAFEKVEHMHTYFVNRTEHKISMPKLRLFVLKFRRCNMGKSRKFKYVLVKHRKEICLKE